MLLLKPGENCGIMKKMNQSGFPVNAAGKTCISFCGIHFGSGRLSMRNIKETLHEKRGSPLSETSSFYDIGDTFMKLR